MGRRRGYVTPWVPSFDLEGSDVTLQSSDGHLFRVHRKNLAASSRVFDDMFAVAGEPGTDPVPLTEAGKLVDRLMCFFYDDRYPDASFIHFEEAVSLAECARKYQMAALGALMRCRLSQLLDNYAGPKNGKTLGQRIRDGYDSTWPLPETSPVLRLFQLARDLRQYDLGHATAPLLVAIRSDGPQPAELDAANWEKLRAFLSARRAAVDDVLFDCRHIVVPASGTPLCLAACHQLLFSIARLHVDPSLVPPSGCTDAQDGCKEKFDNLERTIRSKMPDFWWLLG